MSPSHQSQGRPRPIVIRHFSCLAQGAQDSDDISPLESAVVLVARRRSPTFAKDVGLIVNPPHVRGASRFMNEQPVNFEVIFKCAIVIPQVPES